MPHTDHEKRKNQILPRPFQTVEISSFSVWELKQENSKGLHLLGIRSQWCGRKCRSDSSLRQEDGHTQHPVTGGDVWSLTQKKQDV